jgi:ABC-2 type transport system permease protein
VSTTPAPVPDLASTVTAAASPRLAGEGARLGTATVVVFTQQLARARVARIPLLFVAAFQSIGILLLLRGVVDTSSALTEQQVVAGATVLVAAFVCLNLMAQRLGSLRAEGGLDYYAALDVPGAAVVLGTAGSYGAFAVPGAVVTAVSGAALYGLPFNRLWILAVVLPLAAASLAGLGALLGLLAPKPELATVAGQLGMSAVIFLNLIPVDRFPLVLRWVRALVPSTYAADALAETFHRHVAWGAVGRDLAVCLAVAIVTLALAGAMFRRQVGR